VTKAAELETFDSDLYSQSLPVNPMVHKNLLDFNFLLMSLVSYLDYGNYSSCHLASSSPFLIPSCKPKHRWQSQLALIVYSCTLWSSSTISACLCLLGTNMLHGYEFDYFLNFM